MRFSLHTLLNVNFPSLSEYLKPPHRVQSVCSRVGDMPHTISNYLLMSNKYTKEQLLEKDVQELQSIIREMKISQVDNETKEELVYKILDAQAEVLSIESEPTPKRKRIVSKAPDHVYSATQSGSSERFDSPKEERAAKRMMAAKAKVADAVATQALLGAEGLEKNTKKRRGRPTKEEMAARQAFEDMQNRQAELINKAQAALNGQVMLSPLENEEEPIAEKETMSTELSTTEIEGKEESTSEEVSLSNDMPDFIVEQIRQKQSVATEPTDPDSSEQDALDSLSEHFRQKQAEISEKDSVSSKTPENLEIEKGCGVEDGLDFIIVDDIPVVDIDEFTLDSEERFHRETRYVQEESQVNRFHRFKEDALVNPRLQDQRMHGQREESFAPEAQVLSYRQDIIIEARGVLEVDSQGVGFLRSSDYNYMPSPDDVFVSQNQIRTYALKMGDVVEGKVKVPREGEKYFTLVDVERINGLLPQEVRDRVAFEHLTPLFPDEQFKLSTGAASPLACRVVDLFSPIGKGQRALIVAQPKTGKTILMKQIANAIAANHPDTYLMMLLIDERPEEVTDMARTVNAEVIASTFDEPAARHVRIAQMVLEKAKRMVECGHDVVIFLDSITRLARAFNTVAPASGKILTGGVDANALQKPKRFFGAARNIEKGGSLTIIATALIDTGSKMDEVIFEEFKGTGNMELQLDRSLANKRIFPAVNLIQSSTRRDDLLLNETTLNRMYILRNYMADMSSMEAMEFVKKRLENTISNEEFLMTMNK